MVELIAKEEKADDEQKAWCDSEREDNYAQLDDKTTNKESLEGKVVELTDTIENAETLMTSPVFLLFTVMLLISP